MNAATPLSSLSATLLSDDALVALARDGSRPALEQLHRRHAASLVTWLRVRKLPRDADDVVQDVFLILLERPRFLPATGKVRPWLRGIALRVARQKNALLHAEELVASTALVLDADDREGDLAEPETRRALRF